MKMVARLRSKGDGGGGEGVVVHELRGVMVLGDGGCGGWWLGRG